MASLAEKIILNCFQLNVVRSIPEVAELCNFPYNTTRYHVLALESAGYLECVNPGKKPEFYRLVKHIKPVALPTSCAMAFLVLEPILQTLLPKECHGEIEEAKMMAESTLDNLKRYQPNSPKVAFLKAIESSNIREHFFSTTARQELLGAVNNAIYSKGSLEVNTASQHYYLSDVGLVEMNNILYVTGRQIGDGNSRIHLDIADVVEARDTSEMLSWQQLSMAA